MATEREWPRLSIVPARAFADRRLKTAHLRVLGAIGRFQPGPDGQCFAAIATLATAAGGLDDRRCRRAVSDLVKFGYVRRIERPRQTSLLQLVCDAPEGGLFDPVPGRTDPQGAHDASVGAAPGEGASCPPAMDQIGPPNVEVNGERENDWNVNTHGSSLRDEPRVLDRAGIATVAREFIEQAIIAWRFDRPLEHYGAETWSERVACYSRVWARLEAMEIIPPGFDLPFLLDAVRPWQMGLTPEAFDLDAYLEERTAEGRDFEDGYDDDGVDWDAIYADPAFLWDERIRGDVVILAQVAGRIAGAIVPQLRVLQGGAAAQPWSFAGVGEARPSLQQVA